MVVDDEEGEPLFSLAPVAVLPRARDGTNVTVIGTPGFAYIPVDTHRNLFGLMVSVREVRLLEVASPGKYCNVSDVSLYIRPVCARAVINMCTQNKFCTLDCSTGRANVGL